MLLVVVSITAVIFWQTCRAHLSAFGSQFRSDAAVHTALLRPETDQARAPGESVVSEPLQWGPLATGEARFLMLAPVYRDELPPAVPGWQRLPFPAPPKRTETFRYGGREWAGERLTEPTDRVRPGPIAYWLIGPAGLLVGLGMMRYLRRMLSSRERLAQLVAQRTAELSQAREMLRLVLDAIPVGVQWKNRESVFLGCNRRFAQDAGLNSPAEITGKTDFDLPWKEEAEFLRRWDQQVIRLELPMLDYERPRPFRDGRVRCLRQSKLPLRDAQGTIIGVLSVYEDITERKQAEETLRQSREQLRQRAEELETIMACAPVGLWVAHDPQCHCITGNRMANSLYEAGDQAHGAVACRWFRDGRQLQLEDLPMQQAALRNVELQNTELELWLPSGRRVSLLGSATPLRDAQGRVRGCVGAFLDNTERKRAEGLLAGEKRVLEWIAGHRPLPEVLNEICRTIEDLVPGVMSSILLLDEQGTHLWPAAGPKLPEAWTRTITPLAIGPGVGSCGAAAWEKAQVVVSDIAKDPRWTHYPQYCNAALQCDLRACWSTPILSVEGRLLGTFAMYYHEPRRPLAADLEIIKQVTHLASVAIEHARAAEGLRRAHAELEQRVQERTAELVRANARLAELDRLKSQFLATMSHELRTPLNSIIGFTGILRKGYAGPINAEQSKQLGFVFDSARHLLGLINDLLDLSRIEAGKAAVECKPFDFAEVVQAVVEHLAPLAEQKHLRLAADLPGHALGMVGDRERCFQVLLNLVHNALKFTHRGEVKITARTEGDQLRVCVADTGIGIKPEQRGMLFEAFRQLDGSAKRIYEGTGLGLHLCRRLLTLMHGEIGVESEFGKGSTFSFTLPRQLSGRRASPRAEHEELKCA